MTTLDCVVKVTILLKQWNSLTYSATNNTHPPVAFTQRASVSSSSSPTPSPLFHSIQFAFYWFLGKFQIPFQRHPPPGPPSSQAGGRSGGCHSKKLPNHHPPSPSLPGAATLEEEEEQEGGLDILINYLPLPSSYTSIRINNRLILYSG